MRAENISIDLFPAEADGKAKCPAACGHCPMGAKGEEPKGSKFSPDSLEALDRLTEYLAAKNEDVSALVLTYRGRIEDLAALPIRTGVMDTAFMIGEVPESIDEMKDRVTFAVKAVEALLADMPEGEKTGFRISAKMRNGQSEIEDSAEQIFAGFVRILEEIVPEDLKRISKEWVGMTLDSNAIPSAIFDGLDHLKIQIYNNLQFVGIFTELLGENIVGRRTWTDDQMRSPLSVGSMSSGVEVLSNIHGHEFSLKGASRLIRGGAPEKSFTPLPKDGSPLVLGLFLDHVWVSHDTRHTRDDSVRITYSEFLRVLDLSVISRSTFRENLFAEVERRRV